MKSISLNQATQKEFLQAINDSKPTLILCYADWCGWCQRFKPTWARIKTTLSKNKDINVVEVEYDNISLMPKSLQGVRGFPTLQILKNGKLKHEYQGDRNHDDIVKFAVLQVAKPRGTQKSTLKKKEVKTV